MLGQSCKTRQYAYPQYPCEIDHKGYYVPDSVIVPFVEAAHPVTRALFEQHKDLESPVISPMNRHKIRILEPELSWEESCTLVIAAFHKFHPSLGAKAEEVINTPHRWNLTKTKSGKAGGMCTPAHCDENPNPYAVIQYRFDGTINDPVYIAHELLHLMADDAINEIGLTYRDRKQHMNEIQAFFGQHILYDFLMDCPNNQIRDAAQGHFIGEITRNLYDIPIALAGLDVAHNKQINMKLAIVFARHGIHDNTWENTHIQKPLGCMMESWLGKDWKDYQNAKWYIENILDWEARDEAISKIHKHSMASLIADGLFLQVAPKTTHERGAFLENLLGTHGIKNILEILTCASIDTQKDLDLLAKDTIAHITEPLRQFAPAPTPDFSIPFFE